MGKASTRETKFAIRTRKRVHRTSEKVEIKPKRNRPRSRILLPSSCAQFQFVEKYKKLLDKKLYEAKCSSEWQQHRRHDITRETSKCWYRRFRIKNFLLIQRRRRVRFFIATPLPAAPFLQEWLKYPRCAEFLSLIFFQIFAPPFDHDFPARFSTVFIRARRGFPSRIASGNNDAVS